jgi:hypothetical protein
MIVSPVPFIRFAALAVFATAGALAEDGPVKIVASPPTVEARAGATAVVRLNVEIADTYHIYSPLMIPDPHGSGPTITTLALKSPALAGVNGVLHVSPGRKHFDSNFQMDVLTLEGRAWIDVPLKVAPALAAGEHDAVLVVTYQACTEESCLPPTDLEVPFKISVGSAPGSAAADDPRWREAEELAATLNARESVPGERDRRMQRYAALAWELYTAHPDDPRRWPPFETIARGTLRFITGFKAAAPGGAAGNQPIIDEAALREWTSRAAQVEKAAMTAPDSPETFR